MCGGATIVRGSACLEMVWSPVLSRGLVLAGKPKNQPLRSSDGDPQSCVSRALRQSPHRWLIGEPLQDPSCSAPERESYQRCPCGIGRQQSAEHRSRRRRRSWGPAGNERGRFRCRRHPFMALLLFFIADSLAGHGYLPEVTPIS